MSAVIDFAELLRMALRQRGAGQEEADFIVASLRTLDPATFSTLEAASVPALFPLAKGLVGPKADETALAILDAILRPLLAAHGISGQELSDALAKFQGN